MSTEKLANTSEDSQKLANNRRRFGSEISLSAFKYSSSNDEDCNEIMTKDILTSTNKSYCKSSDNIDDKNESAHVASSIREESMDCNNTRKASHEATA
jgi:GTPase Era involved in 16S rRNA processing